MKDIKPLVSIILPVSNSGKFLSACLESLSSQTYKNSEIIAIDDVSRDDSFAILKRFKKREKRLRIYKNKKRYGLSVTLNRLLNKAKGQYVAFADPYDISSPRRIKKQLNFFLLHPKAVVVGTQCIFLNKKGRKLGKSAFPQENEDIRRVIIGGLSLQPETVMVNRRLLPKDVLRFKKNSYGSPASYPFVYTEVFMKLFQYGTFANLPFSLCSHRKRRSTYLQTIRMYLPSLIKLWFKSITIYDYRPSLKNIFIPLIKPV